MIWGGQRRPDLGVSGDFEPDPHATVILVDVLKRHEMRLLRPVAASDDDGQFMAEHPGQECALKPTLRGHGQ